MVSGTSPEKAACTLFVRPQTTGLSLLHRLVSVGGIHQARLVAMQRAVAALGMPLTTLLVDGRHAPTVECAVETLVNGDTKSLSIAAASVIAKVARDRLMRHVASRYPGFGWATNVGYGTDEHCLGLLRHGLTPHHRRSFEPLRTLFAESDRPADYRFDPWQGASANLHALELRRDLHAVFAGNRQHVGTVKWIRGRWVLKAVGYEPAGATVEGRRPLASRHLSKVDEPAAECINRLLDAVDPPHPGS